MCKHTPAIIFRWIVLVLCLSASVVKSDAGTVNAYYQFQDYTASPLNVRRVTITPLGPSAEYGSAFLSQKPIIYAAATYTSLTNGYLLATNLITGYAYKVAFSDGFSEPTVTNYFGTNLSGTVGAVTNKTTFIEWSGGVAVRVYGQYFNATITNTSTGGGGANVTATNLAVATTNGSTVTIDVSTNAVKSVVGSMNLITNGQSAGASIGGVNLSGTGIVTANSFVGDGSSLTGVGVSAAEVAAIMATNNAGFVYNISKALVFEGDSLTQSNMVVGSNTWANRIKVGNSFFKQFTTMTNFAKAGDTAVQMVTQYPSEAGGVTLAESNKLFAVIAGFNDIGAGSGSNTTINAISNLWRLARASGYKVVASTITTNWTGSWTTGQSADFVAVNNWILSSTTNYDLLMRPDIMVSQTSNSTGDGYHWTQPITDMVASQFWQLFFGYASARFDSVESSNVFVENSLIVKGSAYVTNKLVISPSTSPYKPFQYGTSGGSGVSSLYDYGNITALRTSGGGFQLGNSAAGAVIMSVAEDGTMADITKLTVSPGGGYSPSYFGKSGGSGVSSFYDWGTQTTIRTSGNGLLVGNSANGGVILSVSEAGSVGVTNIIVKSAASITVSISSGSGSPESVVTAPIGSLFLRTDGGASTTLYVKTTGSGNTGWTAK